MASVKPMLCGTEQTVYRQTDNHRVRNFLLYDFGYCAQSGPGLYLVAFNCFQVSLNEYSLASSEHVVPVGSIYGLCLDGDSVVDSIRYGHPTAIRQSAMSHPHGTVVPLECRLTADLLIEDDFVSGQDSCNRATSNMSRSVGDLYWATYGDIHKEKNAFKPLDHLTRARSYQLVFDSEESDVEGPMTKVRSSFHRSTVEEPKLLLIDDPEFVFLEPISKDRQPPHYGCERKYTVGQYPRKNISSLARKAHTKLSRKHYHSSTLCPQLPTSETDRVRPISMQELRITEHSSVRIRKYSGFTSVTDIAIDDDEFADLPDVCQIGRKSQKTIEYSLEESDLKEDVVIPEVVLRSNSFSGISELINQKIRATGPTQRTLLTRKPMSSLDGLWDAVLPPARKTIYRQPTKQNTVHPLAPKMDCTSSLGVKSSELEAESDQDWGEEIAFRYMSDVSAQEPIENKQAEWNSRSIRSSPLTGMVNDNLMESDAEPEDTFVKHTPNRLLTSEIWSADSPDEINEYSVCESTELVRHKKRPSASSSQPVLLIDQHTMPETTYVSVNDAFKLPKRTQCCPAISANLKDSTPVVILRDMENACGSNLPFSKGHINPNTDEKHREIRSHTPPVRSAMTDRSTVSAPRDTPISKSAHQTGTRGIFRSRLPPRNFEYDSFSPLNGHSRTCHPTNAQVPHTFFRLVGAEIAPRSNKPVLTSSTASSGLPVDVVPSSMTCLANVVSSDTQTERRIQVDNLEKNEHRQSEEDTEDKPSRFKSLVYWPRNWLAEKFSSYREQNSPANIDTSSLIPAEITLS